MLTTHVKEERMFRVMTGFCCLVGWMAFGAAAQSAECTGTDYWTVELAETLDLGDGHSVTLIKTNTIGVADDPNAPDHLAGGPCSGYIEVLPDGAVKMDGFCHRTNTAGEMLVDHWWQNVGDEKGTWEWIRGTGKLARLVGHGGWFETVMENGALGVSRWGSSCP